MPDLNLLSWLKFRRYITIPKQLYIFKQTLYFYNWLDKIIFTIFNN